MATSGMSREEIAALMEEKRQTNARRRAEQSAKNAAIEARLAAGGGLSSDNPYASGGTSAPGGAAGAAAPVVAPKVAALSGFSGVVSAITPERGFGFLKSDSGGGDQTWFHISSIMGMGEGRVDASTIAVGTQATWSETPSPTQKGKMMAVEINLATPPGVMAAQRGGGRGGGDRGMGGGMTAQQQQQMQQQQWQQQQWQQQQWQQQQWQQQQYAQQMQQQQAQVRAPFVGRDPPPHVPVSGAEHSHTHSSTTHALSPLSPSIHPVCAVRWKHHDGGHGSSRGGGSAVWSGTGAWERQRPAAAAGGSVGCAGRHAAAVSGREGSQAAGAGTPAGRSWRTPAGWTPAGWTPAGWTPAGWRPAASPAGRPARQALS